jgi:acetyl-CoA C-acetyltransferase
LLFKPIVSRIDRFCFCFFFLGSDFYLIFCVIFVYFLPPIVLQFTQLLHFRSEFHQPTSFRSTMADLDPRAAYIVSYARTPIGLFLGPQSKFYNGPALGAHAIRAALDRASQASGMPLADRVDQVILGMVLGGGAGMAPDRQAALLAGIPAHVPTHLVNKVCASGMRALEDAAHAIWLGDAHIVVAGGMESMSHAPHYLNNLRAGIKVGAPETADAILHDGLTWGGDHMGVMAERLAEKYAITRQEQDDFAVMSYKRSQAAAPVFSSYEIVPLPLCRPGSDQQKDPKTEVMDRDAEPWKLDEAKLRTLKPAFEKNGTVTAGNASTLADGAAAFVVMSGTMCSQLQVRPLAKLVSFAAAAQDPMWFTTSPSLAVPKAVAKAQKRVEDMDLVEINEAYASVALINSRIMGIPVDKVNVLGGSTALGHPLGCSGARIVGTLITALQHRGGKHGVAAVCNGGGGASACVIELV